MVRLFLWLAAPGRDADVEGQTLTFHANIWFRGPRALWIRRGRG
jgi:hypothetical protein